MITTERAKELLEKERQETIDTLETINKEKELIKKYYEYSILIGGQYE